jgi:pimeloyl-ACP methyl ester carboxylesterase
MSAQVQREEARVAPLWGELRYAGELAGVVARHGLRTRRAAGDPPPVMLIPGFLAGDGSLRVLAAWLKRRGHRVVLSGMRANVDCVARAMHPLRERLTQLHEQTGQRVFLIGQSRGGGLARCLAVREPRCTAGVAMLGTPVLDPLAVGGAVRRVVHGMGRLGDLGLPGLFSSSCLEGDCCVLEREELQMPFAKHIRALAVYSRSDAVVDWRACLDPHAQALEVSSSHCGMSVHAGVYELLGRALDGKPLAQPSGDHGVGRVTDKLLTSTAKVPLLAR